MVAVDKVGGFMRMRFEDGAEEEFEAGVRAAGGPAAPVGPTTAFRTRAQAMLDVLLVALPDGEGERLLRERRGDAQLAPLALNALAHHELLSPEDMTDAEQLLLLAENLLQLGELPQRGIALAASRNPAGQLRAEHASNARSHN
ncbi:hypothetical protein [Streptomyces sp. YIM S03343]